MFTENLFTKLLQLEENWVVKSVDTDFESGENFVHIECLLDHLEVPKFDIRIFDFP